MLSGGLFSSASVIAAGEKAAEEFSVVAGAVAVHSYVGTHTTCAWPLTQTPVCRSMCLARGHCATASADAVFFRACSAAVMCQAPRAARSLSQPETTSRSCLSRHGPAAQEVAGAAMQRDKWATGFSSKLAFSASSAGFVLEGRRFKPLTWHLLLDSKYGRLIFALILCCLECWVKSMGSYWYIVYHGYVRIPDQGPILRAHGFKNFGAGRSTEALASPAAIFWYTVYIYVWFLGRLSILGSLTQVASAAREVLSKVAQLHQERPWVRGEAAD